MFDFSKIPKPDQLKSTLTQAKKTVSDAATSIKVPDSLPSKGIVVYTYISCPSALSITLTVPGRAPVVHRDHHVFRTERLEIESGAIKYPTKRTGRFEVVVEKEGGNVVTRQWIDIDPVTGLVDEKSSSMDDLLNETRSIVSRDLAICFGMYRAGPGQFGLPGQHQVYIVATQNWSAWQGHAAPRGSKQADKPFSHMVLPAPHDVGMNTMATVNAIIGHAGPAGAAAVVDALPGFKAATPVLQALIGGASKLTAAKIAPDIVASLAITQKDSIAHMCSIGARYFEFRPAHCHERIIPHIPFEDKLFFQHGPIPGMAYDDFLRDIVSFLQGHRDEIVVVHIRWDGVPGECRRPDAAELKRYLDAALAPTEGKILAGSLNDMRNASIKALRESGKRLLMVVDAPDVLGTYDDAANATLDGSSILAAFEHVLRGSEQERRCLTLAQCQATPTLMADVLRYSIATADASTMLLMSTKARCGHLMLPWLRKNASSRCRKDRLLVVMDDFIDGSVADVAVALTRERLA